MEKWDSVTCREEELPNMVHKLAKIKGNSAKKLSCAQNDRGSAAPGGSTYVPSGKAEMLGLLSLLTENEQLVILGSIKSLLSEQELSAAVPVSIGQ